MDYHKDRIFVDSRVLIAASISDKGSANDLMQYGKQSLLRLYFSKIVLAETERNLSLKYPVGLSRFHNLRSKNFITQVNPERMPVEQIAKTIEPKDAPIVAGAIAAGAPYLATYDRKHLLNKQEMIQFHFGVMVTLPADLLILLNLAKQERAA